MTQELTPLQKELLWHINWHWGWKKPHITWFGPESLVLQVSEIDDALQPDWLTASPEDFLSVDIAVANVDDKEAMLVDYYNATREMHYGTVLVTDNQMFMQKQEGERGWIYC